MQEMLWFVSRACGLVSLLLLTGTVVLGCAHATRASAGRWQRFTLHALHRNLSLLAVVFLAVHIGSAIIDGYVNLGWLDAFVPFVAGYHPIWIGLGAMAFDILLAVIITSLLRGRLSHRVWRSVHLASYALWPLALLHGLGIGGSDAKLTWVIGLNVVCAAVVAASITRRLLIRHPDAKARGRGMVEA
ncbi:MAG: ferric reductase-like transmembrane domain-containing protein [Pseudonocardiales bacterium]|nr:ferric reductase-like transmembrane domain-containing protein [Pseudonocardiales bacterium]